MLHVLFNEFMGPRLQVVMIQLGGNDLGLIRGKALVMQVIEDLKVIKARWPGVWVIWSAIIPRMSWQNAIDPRVMNKARKNSNCEIGRVLRGSLGQFLPHPEMC